MEIPRAGEAELSNDVAGLHDVASYYIVACDDKMSPDDVQSTGFDFPETGVFWYG